MNHKYELKCKNQLFLQNTSQIYFFQIDKKTSLVHLSCDEINLQKSKMHFFSLIWYLESFSSEQKKSLLSQYTESIRKCEKVASFYRVLANFSLFKYFPLVENFSCNSDDKQKIHQIFFNSYIWKVPIHLLS